MVGVDLGATAVRVAEVSGVNKKSFAMVTKAAFEQTPRGAIVAGRIKEPTAVAWALSRALKSAGISPYGIVLGLSSPETAIARVSMPATLKPEEWAGALRTSDKPVSPKIPIGKSSLSLYGLGPEPDEENQNRILLAAAAHEEQVRDLLRVCREAKVTPRAIDLSGAATVRCITRTVAGNEDVATLVDIGASKVTVATRAGLHLRSLRTLETGGEAITRAMKGAGDISWDEAEEFKMSNRLPGATSAPRDEKAAEVASLYGAVQETSVSEATTNPLLDAMSNAADALIDQIASAIEADAAHHPNAPTQGIHLVGGGALMRGLKERLIQRVGCTAALGRAWAAAVPSKRTESLLVDGVEDAVMMQSLATAIGLALWEENR